MGTFEKSAAGTLLFLAATLATYELDSAMSHRVDQDIVNCNQQSATASACVDEVQNWNGNAMAFPVLEIAGILGTLALGSNAVKALQDERKGKTIEIDSKLSRFSRNQQPWPDDENLD